MRYNVDVGPQLAAQTADFVRDTVNDTFAAGTPIRNGVLLEKNLKRLL